MTTRVRIAGIVLASSLLFAPGLAVAEVVLTPFAGQAFGGDGGAKPVNFGGAFGWISASGLGVEADVSYLSDFFDTKDTTGYNSNVTTLMGNVLFAAPPRGAGFRPYVTGGVGLLRARVEGVGQFFGNVTTNDFAIDAGAGLFVFFAQTFGVRGDVRYFRSLRNNNDNFGDLGLGDFDFWRWSVGASFKF